ncbi:MAG: hypothetical protein IJK56_08610 [Firmicutes bacterium]|nr:hypothetical protein [Bacillota bacterium]
MLVEDFLLPALFCCRRHTPGCGDGRQQNFWQKWRKVLYEIRPAYRTDAIFFEFVLYTTDVGIVTQQNFLRKINYVLLKTREIYRTKAEKTKKFCTNQFSRGGPAELFAKMKTFSVWAVHRKAIYDAESERDDQSKRAVTCGINQQKRGSG